MFGKPVIEKKVKAERTGWRDLGFSQHHRGWGFDCPAQDVDFLLIEYDRAKAVAFVEYKSYKSTTFGSFIGSAGHKALGDVATDARRPAFIVLYSENFDWYVVHSLNTFAEKQLLKSNYHPRFQYMDELSYVSFLYAMRQKPCPVDVKMRCQTRPVPPEQVNSHLQHVSTNDAMKYLKSKEIDVEIIGNEIVLTPEHKVTDFERSLLKGKLDSVYHYLNPTF
jgi:hypothetical protein